MALGANRNTHDKGFDVLPHFVYLPVADNVHIYEGGMVGVDSAGRARPMTASATTPFCAGRAEEEADNTVTGHTAGGISVRVKCGIFAFKNDSGTAVTDASRFNVCYAVDDETVSGDGTSRAVAGLVIDVPASGDEEYGNVWVAIFPAYNTTTEAANLASTASGKGASLIGVQDAAALLAASTVEAALAELVKYEPVALADPGDGAAIPVTRSANVAITIAAGATETNTLAIPTFKGQRMVLSADVVGAGGTRAVTAAAAINQAGNTHMTFGAARAAITLEAIQVAGALVWQVIGNDGVALS